MKQDKPKYTIITHEVRIGLKITTTDYCIADIVTKLMSHPDSKTPGWYYGDQEYLAKIIGVSTKTIQRGYKKLEESGLLEKDNLSGHIRTTSKWYKKAYLDIGQNVRSVDKMSGGRGQNVRNSPDKMSDYNNKYNKSNNEGLKKLTEEELIKENDRKTREFLARRS